MRVEVSFAIDNTSVCEVDSQGHVRALEVGSTTLTGTVQATNEEGNFYNYGTSTIEVVVRSLSGNLTSTQVGLRRSGLLPFSPCHSSQAYGYIATLIA